MVVLRVDDVLLEVLEIVDDVLEDVETVLDVLVVVVAIVSGVKKYKCPISGLTFITLVVLFNHILISESLAAGSLHLIGILGYFLYATPDLRGLSDSPEINLCFIVSILIFLIIYTVVVVVLRVDDVLDIVDDVLEDVETVDVVVVQAFG